MVIFGLNRIHSWLYKHEVNTWQILSTLYESVTGGKRGRRCAITVGSRWRAPPNGDCLHLAKSKRERDRDRDNSGFLLLGPNSS